LQIKIISSELQNISGNTVIKIKSVVTVINITLLLLLLLLLMQTPQRPHLHSHQSDAPKYIKTLDSAGVDCGTMTGLNWPRTGSIYKL
jgi:hypothetical protein